MVRVQRPHQGGWSAAPGTLPPSPAGVPQIGQYLVAAQLVTAHEVRRALDRKGSARRAIGMMLVEDKLITARALARTLVTQSLDRLLAGEPPRFLGEHALSAALVTPDQLEQALAAQIRLAAVGVQCRLGALLLDRRAISAAEHDILLALAAVRDPSSAPHN